jgi:hypothetical protein
MNHECEFKQGLISDVVSDSWGTFYCRMCRKQLTTEQIHPSVFKKERKR